MLADIEANLKLLIDARWQNAKKFRLPPIVDLDKRQKVLSFSYHIFWISFEFLVYFFLFFRVLFIQSSILLKTNGIIGSNEIRFFEHCASKRELTFFLTSTHLKFSHLHFHILRSSYFFTYQFWLFFLPILVYFIFSRQDSEDLTKLNAKNRKTHSEPAHATNEDQ